MCSVAVPEFFTETLRDVLVPCVTVPKSRLPGTSVTAGAGGSPTPFNCADSAGGDALLGIVTAAVRLAVAGAGKETRREHELPGCRTVGAWQVSPVVAKSPAFWPVTAMVFRFNPWPPLLVMVNGSALLVCPIDKL